MMFFIALSLACELEESDTQHLNGDPYTYGLVDVDGVAVVHIVDDADLSSGFSYDAFDDVVQRGVIDRDNTYDFALVIHSARLPDQFVTAAAFHLAFNRDLPGTGADFRENPDIPVRSGIWMNNVDFWDDWPNPGRTFVHEVGHYWLSFPRLEDESTELLGRQTAHWSYFLNGGNTPMEGNAWTDNGDGTFTTDWDATPEFSQLDKYLMGFIGPEDVPPFFYITDVEGTLSTRSSAPRAKFDFDDETIQGTRVDITIEDVIAGNGLVEAPASTSITMAPILVLGPNEALDAYTLEKAKAHFAQWETDWATWTGGASEVSIALENERSLPPVPTAPTLIPEGAR